MATTGMTMAQLEQKIKVLEEKVDTLQTTFNSLVDTNSNNNVLSNTGSLISPRQNVILTPRAIISPSSIISPRNRTVVVGNPYVRRLINVRPTSRWSLL